jgi:hypothetical protein
MSFHGFLIRLVVVALTTWIFGAVIESFGWGLYFALLPFLYWEMLRPRPLRNPPPCSQETPGNAGEPDPPPTPPTQRLP